MWAIEKHCRHLLCTLALGLALCGPESGGAVCSASRVEIDVLVVFDESAAGAATMNIQEMAQRAVANLNDVLVRSKLDQEIHYNLAGTKVLTGYRSRIPAATRELLTTVIPAVQRERISEQDALEACMEKLFSAFVGDYDAAVSGNIRELSEARDRCKADIVLMAVDFKQLCLLGMGWGYHMTNELEAAESGGCGNSHTFLPERHFMAEFHMSCLIQPFGGMDVFSHETMHVMGCGHSDRQRSGPGPFYYADSTGYHSDDGHYCTLLSYNEEEERVPHDTVQQVSGDSRTINALSGPYAPKLMGADASLSGLPPHMGDRMHNNRETLRRNAAVVACYRMGGNERVLNASRETALPMPPLVDKSTFLSMVSRNSSASTASVARALQSVMPGLDREGTLYSTVLGTNAPAPLASAPLPGGSGKVVWYALDVQQPGHLQIGVREYASTPGLKPVLGLWNASGAAVPARALASPELERSGILYALDADVEQPGRVYIAVDSGDSHGGQFSIFANLKPVDGSTPAAPPPPDDAPATTGDSGSTETPQPASAGESGSRTDGSADVLLFLLAFLSGGLAVWLFCGRKADAGPAVPPPSLPTVPPEAAAQGQAPRNGAATRIVPAGNDPTRKVSTASLVLDCTLSDGSRKRCRIPMGELAAHRDYFVGRKSPCELCIPDPTVSGRHAVFKVRCLDGGHSVLLLGDAGSSNGTWLDGTRLQGDNCMKVRQGSKIQLGKVAITVIIE